MRTRAGQAFPRLQPAEQSAYYKGTAVESKDRHKFPRHLKAWGAEHTGPGVRILDHTRVVEHRWRHDTFKDERESELQFFDELPTNGGKGVAKAAAPSIKAPPTVRRNWNTSGVPIEQKYPEQ